MAKRVVNCVKSAKALLTNTHCVSSIEPLESRWLLSTSWFVAKNGSDQNPGTLSSPFLTIQHAAQLATAGDHIEIRAGTYHEAVTPSNSGSAGAPITFESYHDEKVVVSGADPVSTWSAYSGSVYQAAMPWTLGSGNDQVFVDGQMVNEARFPNTSTDISHPTLAHASQVTISGNTATLYDPALAQPAGYWTGATIHITPGQAWIAQTGTVLGSSPGQITYSFVPLDSYELPTAGNAYYLTGTFKALDGPGEWYRDPSGNLFLRAPASDNPAGHDIEVKHRTWAFDVTGESYITIQNISTFSAGINSDHDSNNLVLNHIHARYIGQFVSLPQGWTVPSRTGILLAGEDSVIENSTIAFGAGDGVVVKGANSRVSNNVIHDVDYNAADCAAVRVVAPGTSIDHNTIYNTGRSAILHYAGKLTITYNLIHDAGLQTTEAGGIYTVNTDGQGTVIAYNKISNMHSGGFGQTGLFLDNNSDNYIVHHNQVSNVDHALKMNFTCRNNNIYNNTLDGTVSSVLTNRQGDWDGTRLTHNLLTRKAVFNTGAVVSGNSSIASQGLGAGDFTAGANAVVADPEPPAAAPTPTPPSTTGTGSTGSNSGSTGTSPGTTTSSPNTGTTTGTGTSDGNSGAAAGTTTGSPPSSSGTGAATSGTDNSGAGTAVPDPVVPAEPPAPADATVDDYGALIVADRAAIKAAQLQRSQTLRDLNKTIHADADAIGAANRQLRIALAAARRAHKVDPSSPVDVSALSADLAALRLTLANDRLTLKTTRQSDFSNIVVARATLKAHRQALTLARRQLKQSMHS